MKKIFFLSLLIITANNAYASPPEKCDPQLEEEQYAQCMKKAADSAELKLKNLYKKLLIQAKDDDENDAEADLDGAYGGFAGTLTDSQKSWTSFHKVECGRKTVWHRSGPPYLSSYYSCVIEMTESRIKDLSNNKPE